MSEQLLASWDFRDGTLGPFSFRGNGIYEVISDPLGVQPYVCKLSTPAEGASILKFGFNGKASVRVRMRVAFPLAGTQPWLRISNEKLYSGTHLIQCWTRSQDPSGYPDMWRINAYSDQGVIAKDVGWGPQLGKVYEAEAYVKLGHTDGEARLIIDAIEEAGITGITNNDVVQLIDFAECGMFWAAAGREVLIYSINIYGVTPIYRTVSGTVQDSSGNPISEATVSIGTEYVDFTDMNGFFNLVVPSGSYILKAAKMGYEPSYIGVDVSVGDVTDLVITLAEEAPPIPGKPWDVKAFNIFPFWFKFSSPQMDSCLEEIRVKFGNLVNYVDYRILWHIDPNDPNNVVFYDWNGLGTLEEIQTGIQKAHARGFKVLLGHVNYDDPNPCSPTDYTAFFENFKQRIVEVAKFAEANGVETLHIAWELALVNSHLVDGTFNMEWNHIVSAVRQVYGGQVVYQTNRWYTDTGYQQALANSWWANLDYIAISSFIPLTSKYDPTLGELFTAWQTSQNVDQYDYMKYFGLLSEHFEKKLLLNTGFHSCDGTNTAPWKKVSDIPDEQEQALCWESFFEAWKDNPHIIGASLEHYDKPYSPTDTTGSFRGKLAENYIKVGLETVSPTPISPLGRILAPIAVGTLLSLLEYF